MHKDWIQARTLGLLLKDEVIGDTVRSFGTICISTASKG